MRTCIQACILLATASAAAGPLEADRGALLYTTHCVECHTSQMHWRAQRLARDWGSLQAQVRRWQGEARLGWQEDDIEAVTRYLNDTIYRFPRQQALGMVPVVRIERTTYRLQGGCSTD